MIVYGYVKDYNYTGDGTFMIKTRIPVIHGPFLQDDAKGKKIRNYVSDDNLPYYPSVILPHTPVVGEVVALSNIKDSTTTEFIIIGLTGGSYYTGATNIGG